MYIVHHSFSGVTAWKLIVCAMLRLSCRARKPPRRPIYRMGVGMTTKPLTMGIWCYNFDDCVFVVFAVLYLYLRRYPWFLARGDIMVIWASPPLRKSRFKSVSCSFIGPLLVLCLSIVSCIGNHHKYKAQNATIEIPNNPSKPDRYINSWTHQEWSRRSLAMLNEMGHDHSDVEWYLMLKENGWFA